MKNLKNLLIFIIFHKKYMLFYYKQLFLKLFLILKNVSNRIYKNL